MVLAVWLYSVLHYSYLYDFVFIGLFTILTHYWLSRTNTPPGPWGLPLVGYLPFLTKTPHVKINELSKKYGPVIGFNCGRKYVVVLNDYESTVEAYKQNASNGRTVETFYMAPNIHHIGDLNSDEWTIQRNFINVYMKFFSRGEKGMNIQKTIEEETTALLTRIEKMSDLSAIDLRGVLGQATSNVAWTFNWGKNFEFVKPTTLDAILHYQFAFLDQGTILSPGLLFPPLAALFRKYSKDLIEMVQIEKDVERVIDEEIEAHEQRLDFDDPKDYIDHYLIYMKKSKHPLFTKSTLNGNMQMLAIGGTDASRGALEWMWMVLCQYQDVQQKMYEEIVEVFGTERTPTWELRDKLPYTMAAIHEIERFVTIVPLSTPRKVMEDMTVKGFLIPKDTVLVSNTWAINNDTSYWEDPWVLRPERYLDDLGQFDVSKRFVTFSIGKRRCPGDVVAQIEVFSFTTAIIQNFKLVPPPDGLCMDEIQSLVVIASKPFVKFERR